MQNSSILFDKNYNFVPLSKVSTQECQYKKNRGMNHVNAKILEFVSRLHLTSFLNLYDFTQRYKNFI